MRCLFCPSHHQIPHFCSSVPTVREPRSNDARAERRVHLSMKSAFFYICIHLSRCCYGCIGRVLRHRLLTASVSNGGPLSCVPALVLILAIDIVSKTQKIPRFLLSRLSQDEPKKSVVFVRNGHLMGGCAMVDSLVLASE